MKKKFVMKTPAGADFNVPTPVLFEAIRSEWENQGDKINPSTMPLTQLASTAIDLAGKDRDKIIDLLVAYVGSELLCHHAEEPDALRDLQIKTWQPILDWAEQYFDDTIFQTGTGIMPIQQTDETFTAMREAIQRYDAFYLTGLRQAVDVSGSLILGLALLEKHLTAQQVFEASELDATFQMQKWGSDPATEKRHETTLKELLLCERWFNLLSQKH